MTACVIGLDQGTTGTTAILVDARGRVLRRAAREIPQHFPQPGWVEHDPDDLWRTAVETIEEVARDAPEPIAALGLTNQRETTILWDRTTGRPLHRAIVWQCRRTADRCRELAPHAALFRERTGLPLDAYFSGTKIRWILDRVELPRMDNVAFGTVDAWLSWNLTGGQTHATDFTNASRTLLFDLRRRAWDPQLAEILGVPLEILPEVRASNANYGTVDAIPALRGVAIHAVIGDQQSALFGQGCFAKGSLKNTFGTGGFLVMNTGDEAVRSERGLVTTLAVAEDGGPCFALEGSVFIAGAAIQWLRDGLGIIESSSEVEALARSVPDTGGVVLVPAFVGLGAPHWAMDARGAIVGLTRGIDPRPHRPCGDRVARLPDPRRVPGHARRSPGRTPGAPRRRRRRRERSPAPVPGRPTGHSREAPAQSGIDRAGCRRPRRRGRGRLAGRRPLRRHSDVGPILHPGDGLGGPRPASGTLGSRRSPSLSLLKTRHDWRRLACSTRSSAEPIPVP